jgi:hypothetical protein
MRPNAKEVDQAALPVLHPLVLPHRLDNSARTSFAELWFVLSLIPVLMIVITG